MRVARPMGHAAGKSVIGLNIEPGYVAASVKVARYLFGQKAASLHRAVD